MLEITLLKVRHQNEEEAKKLRPYIEACDVYSIESVLMTESNAQKEEKDWLQGLEKSRTKFTADQAKRHQPLGKRMSEYNLKRDDLLYRNKKPFFFIERLSTEEYDDQKARLAEHARQQKEWVKRNKGMEEFLEGATRTLKDFFQVTLERDERIGKSLETVEEIIREKYDLRKEKLNFTLDLGAAHRPEAHTLVPLKVVELFGELNKEERLSLEMQRKYDENRRIDPEDVLRAVYLTIMTLKGKGPVPNVWEIGASEVERLIERETNPHL